MLKMLENAVMQLLDSYELLKAENRGLRDAVDMKELEIKGLKDKIKRLDGQKVHIRDKVDALLARLNGLIPGA